MNVTLKPKRRNKGSRNCTKKSQRGEITEGCLKISSAFSFFAYVQSPTWAFLPSLLSQNMQAHRETFWTLRECSQGSQGKLAMKGSDVAWEPQKSPWAKCATLPVSSLALLCQVATTPVSVSTHYSESHIDSNIEQRWFRLAFPSLTPDYQAQSPKAGLSVPCGCFGECCSEHQHGL